MKRALGALLCFSLVACGTEELPAPSIDAGADAGTPLDDAGQVLDAGETAADAGEDPCLGQHARSLVSLSLAPGTMKVTVGAKARFAVNGTFDDGCVANVSGSLFYTVGNPATARVVEVPPDEDSPLPGRAVEGLAEGNTIVIASTQANGAGMTSNSLAVEVTPGAVQPGSTETRGIWVTRFEYDSASKVQSIIKNAADNNFNTVYFQVRGAGDAYYRSSIVPWWQTTGRPLGTDPGWDPLQVAIDAAHARGLKLHAYVNALSGWSSSTIPSAVSGAPQHILKQHPEWTCKDASGGLGSEYVWIAADDGYIEHFGDVVDEILSRYDVDGIHMDRLRTPEREFCHTLAFDSAFTAQSALDWGAFQRAQIDKLVAEVYARVLAKKPSAIVSAAVWGIHKRLPNTTGSCSEGFASYHQDSIGWMQKGIIDQINPMIYWGINPGTCTDWAALVDYFLAGANGRQVVAGMHARENEVGDFPKIRSRIDYARTTAAAGTVIFSSSYITQDGFWDDFLAGPYAQPDEPTPMTHR